MTRPRSATPRLLVVDGYTAAGRRELSASGASEAWQLFLRVLETLAPEAKIDVAFPADADDALPEGVALSDYDGALWTGSSLTIYHHEHDPHVSRQVVLARALLDAGVPCYGSCWAAQVAVTACGGACARSPRGLEFGIIPDLTLTSSGRDHPLYRGKPARFSSFAIHFDEVVDLAQATHLAHNAHSRVQAVAVARGGTPFWATQYHPEYDLYELARLANLRRGLLLAGGLFPDDAAIDRYVAALDELHRDPDDHALAQRLGVDETLLDPRLRWREFQNWLEEHILPRA